MEVTRNKKGLWSLEEDKILVDYINLHGKGRWSRVAKMTGLKRCGKSCRLRWINYLSPNVKRGDFSEEEEDLIIRLHNLLGNRWSLIAGRVPGRTDNQVKNHWKTHLSKKLGVKKGKCNVGACSLTRPREGAEKLEILRDSTSKLPINGSDGRVMGPNVTEGPENAAPRTFEPQDPTESECYMSSYWFFNDNLSLNNPSLMEIFR